MPFKIAAQISTAHTDPSQPALDDVLRAIAAAQAILPIDVLIIGGRTRPDLFSALTGPQRPVKTVFAWYNLLSDYPGQAPTEGVINFRGQQSGGWGGWAESGAEVAESFAFGCPNHPEVQRKTLAGAAALLDAFPFDGLFLDKFRFPSPAGGLEHTFSCFCPFCQQAARAEGLDLNEVQAALRSWPQPELAQKDGLVSAGAPWLAAITSSSPILQAFLRFRAASITRLVQQAAALTRARGRQLGLDLFSPAFAFLVGQDYAALAPLASWAKPMTYRAALGPAGLRLETTRLLNGLHAIYDLSESACLEWASHHQPGFSPAGFAELARSAVPLPWVENEIRLAAQNLRPCPAYFGLETVSFPGIIDITPPDIEAVLAAGLRAGASGAVISWDLMHTPAANLRALAGSILG
ncbi:MAG TPA: hypothetical protein PKW33_19285 [Anaerolineaceae bacterium]|nr:hypothetical protein [Anaerolineaceae bacterium]HPN53747.1 hypothetical protein [Anaerolineaceae bacterium]